MIKSDVTVLIERIPSFLFLLFLYFFYSVLSAVTGSLFAAFLDGITPPSSVKRTLKRIRMSAGTIGSTALMSVVPAR